MLANHVIEALSRMPGVERTGDNEFRLEVEGGGTFYFGEEGERVAVSGVKEVQVLGEILELACPGERAVFPCEELIGFRVSIKEEGSDVARHAGFSQ